jgi:hypothetical protein
MTRGQRCSRETPKTADDGADGKGRGRTPLRCAGRGASVRLATWCPFERPTAIPAILRVVRSRAIE